MNLNFQIDIRKQQRPIISIDAFGLRENRINFLFGESGIGKSLISKAIYGLIDPARLTASINGRSYGDYLSDPQTLALGKNGFFVFQEPSSHLNPLIRLADQLREGSLGADADEAAILRHLWDDAPDEAIRRILSVYPQPYRPSGGEKQRILLAMAFKKINQYLEDPPAEGGLFVFDEPTGSLDNHFRNLFLTLLIQKFRREPFTTLIITHDYSIISEILRSHADLQFAIDFRELRHANGSLTLHDFAPETYLNWLQNAPAFAASKNNGAPPLVSMSSGYRVFGKTMAFYQGDVKVDALHISRGEMVYVKAASGIGKTTLVKIMLGLMPAADFTLTIAGRHFDDHTPAVVWRKHVWGKTGGMVFQHADEALNMQSAVKDVFAGLPIKPPLSDSALAQRLNEMFDQEIDEQFLKKPVGLLSGGQKQRLNLLRTLLLDTDLVIMDEPLNGLDFESIQRVLEAIHEKQSQGKAILMISHNEDIFDAIVPPASIYHLKAGEPAARNGS